jgi:site-specific DNA-cytosine methylase
VAFKQAFIERNYGTKVIFRDIRDFSKPDAEVATTAYGAEVPIPGDLDLLVAGFSCVDFSMLNNKKKTIDAGGESGDTFKAIIDYCEKYRPKIVILENVCHAPWKKIEAEAWPAIGYAAVWQRVNTRDFFLPETRVRGYMMVVDARLHHDPTGMKHIPRPLKEVEKITAMWKENMDGLKRPASCPPEAFLLDADDQNLMRALEELAGDLRTRVVDWAACQGRHHDVRSLLGLGQGRPITQWVESGGCKPIDYMQKEFFRTQPDRVRDTADIWYLRGLLRGIDILHKTRHMDMSQNIDRDTDRKAAGLIGCITPNVIAFCSTRGAPLAGHELLALQGLPIYRLDLTREKQTQLRDLAGNAMTSTVVGAAILAALTAAYKTLPEADPEQMDEDTTPTAESIFAESDLETVDLSLTDYSPISATDAMTVARDSVKLCNCEGSLHKTDRPIQQCSLCRHTTCSKCGSNPTHEYSPLPAALLNERVWPNQVDTVLRRCLPLVITLEGVTDETINTLKAEYGDDIDNDEWARCINLVRVAVKSELRLQNIKRGGVWTVNYHSETAHLQLSLTPQSVQWNLYAKAAKDIPANHKLRKALANPIMRMSPDGGDITEGTWQFRLPKLHKILLSIRGCGELTPSFEARMGLAKFVDTEVCSEYEVSVPDDQKHLLDTDISGTYQLLPNCGMAWGSLHVRTSDLGSSKPLFFYMDPHRLGHPKDDCYVFSYDKRRLNYGEKRPIVTQIAPSWRETKYEKVIDESTGEVSYKREGSKQLLSWEDVCKSQSVHCQVPGRWIDLPDARFSQTRDKGLLHTETATTLVLSESPDSCRTSHVVFRGLVSLPRPQLTPWAQGDWLEIAPIDYPEFFRAYGWATDKGGLLERLGDWIAGEESSCKVCSVCAPPAPRIEWKLEEKRLSKAEAAAAKKSRENSSEEDEYDEDAKPKKAVKAKKDDRKIIPIENPEGAARYERALKAQPKPFVVRINSDDASVEIALSINPQSLMHQAVAKFPDVDAQKLSVSYRLRTDYAAPPVADLPAFTIGDNKKDNQWEQPAGFNYPLRPEQLRSLGWMIAQERGTGKVFTEEETHEVHVPQIRWLAEGRAQREAYIRGGVLADQVGYGKTVTTLALIASQRFEDEMSAEEDVKGCIPIKATLILVPKQLPAQWNAEIKKFLARKSNYNVLVIKDLKTLEHTTINEFREADIIIATWALCEGDNYLFRIAQFAGMVEVAEKSTGRASAAWYQEARTAMAEHVEVLKSGDRDLKDLIDIRLAENREQAMQDVTFAPIKRLRGKAYVDAKAKKANGTAKAARPAADQLLPRPDVFGLEKLQKGKKYWTSTTCPLLEWFSFARVVVDEYTYVTGQEGQVIANIQARCRWILSATPPLEDFTDVKTLAKFLRIHLGVDDITPGVTKASNIKALEKDKTNTELFQTFRSSHSPAWHERRHGIAQSFLDDFVRRNIADIKAIEGSDHILPVRLPAEQRAIYLEIDNWLRMNEQMAKKGARHFGGNDRSRRIHDVIKGAESAGEPLLKCATTFSLGGHDEFGVKNAKSACDAVVKVRRKQVTDLVEDFKAKLRQAEWLHGICGGEVEKYVNWQSHVGLNVYGDRPTMEEIQRMVAEAKDERQDDHWHEFYVSAREKQIIDKKNAAAKAAKKKPKKKRSGSDLDSDEEYDSEGGVVRDNRRLKPEGFDPQNNMDAAVWELRLVTSDLNRYAQELVTRRRGLRFFERVRDSQRAYGELENGDSASKTFECSKCGEERSPDDVSFLCECGHLICTACLDNRETKGAFNCTAQGCNGVNMPYQIVPAAELGVQEHRNSKSEDHQGQKIEDIVALVKKIPDGEQVLLFAQFQDLMKKIAMAFRKEGIKHVAMHEKGDAASKLTEFQTNRDIRSMKKVLLLNIGDSSAAGS